MKNLIVSLLLFFISIPLQAQQNEVKLDAFGFVYEELNISYEKPFSEKLGIEIGIGYIYESRLLDTVDYFSSSLPPGNYGPLSYKQRAWSFTIGAKYYLFPKPLANRFYIGTYMQFRTKPKIEDDYFEAYEKYNGMPNRYRPNASFIVGGMIGYKFLFFEQKIILEPAFGLGVSIEESDFDVGGFGITSLGYYRLNLGYRF